MSNASESHRFQILDRHLFVMTYYSHNGSSRACRKPHGRNVAHFRYHWPQRLPLNYYLGSVDEIPDPQPILIAHHELLKSSYQRTSPVRAIDIKSRNIILILDKGFVLAA